MTDTIKKAVDALAEAQRQADSWFVKAGEPGKSEADKLWMQAAQKNGAVVLFLKEAFSGEMTFKSDYRLYSIAPDTPEKPGGVGKSEKVPFTCFTCGDGNTTLHCLNCAQEADKKEIERLREALEASELEVRDLQVHRARLAGKSGGLDGEVRSLKKERDALKAEVESLREWRRKLVEGVMRGINYKGEPQADADGWIPFEKNSGRPEGLGDDELIECKTSSGLFDTVTASEWDRGWGWNKSDSGGDYITHWRRSEQPA